MFLNFTRSGSPDAPAIFFLPGMAMGQWMWFDQTQYFADYDCYNVDLPGHGGSNQIEWCSFEHSADCVAQLIKHETSGKPVYLVGMSLGAIVGLHVLAQHPELINRAVLTGALAERPPRWIISLQGGILSVLLPTTFGKKLFARMLHLPPDAMPYYTESISALSMPSFKRIVSQLADYSPPKGQGLINVPTLFVTGEKDIAVNRNAVQKLAQEVPEAVGVYAPRLHHGWNGEDPALFNAMTRAWIEELPLPKSLIPAGSAPT